MYSADRNVQVPSPTLASLIGALSEGSGQAQIAAKEVLHPDEWPKLRPLPLSQAKPNWLPGQDMAERLAPGALLEVAVPCEIRYTYTPAVTFISSHKNLPCACTEIDTEDGIAYP